MIIPVHKFLSILCIFSLSILVISSVFFALVTNDLLLFTIIMLIILLGLPSVIQWMSGKSFDLFVPPVFFSVVIFLGYILPIPSFLAGEDPFSILWGYP